MPLKGLGLIRVRECFKDSWEKILNEVEVVLARSGYDDRTHPYGKRWNKYETIQYTKKLKTLERVEELELMTRESKVGMELGAILMSIDYVDDSSEIASEIRLKPYCWGWDSKWCENGMTAIDLVLDVFAKTGLFKCVYYCGLENQDFVTDAERKEIEETTFNIALLTNPDFGRKIIALADNLEKKTER